MNCTCGKELGRHNKSGLCSRCFNRSRNADPEFQKRRLEGIRRKYADPAHRAKMAKVITQNSKRWAATPEGRAWMEQNGRRLATEVLRRPDVMAMAISPEARAKANQTRQEEWYGFCPLEHRETYKFLRHIKKLSKDEAMAAINQSIECDQRRLSPFERQDRALAKGAKLVANDRGPAFGEAVDYGEAKWERLASA